MRILPALLLLTPLSAAIQITSPAPGSTLSGLITFTASAPHAASVDYWIAGHSIVTGRLPSATPYAITLDTATLWDGPVQFVAVARDSGGNILDASPPLNATLSNFRRTEIRLLAPALNQPLSGPVTFKTHAADPRGIQAFVYSLDGRETPHTCNCGKAFTDSFTLDTTTLLNGTHHLVIEIVPSDSGSGTPAQGIANAAVQFTVANARAPIELRSNLRSIYFHPGARDPVQLTPRILYNDRSSDPVAAATYISDKPNTARVTEAGLITPGPQPGIATLTITAAGKTATVTVHNLPHAGFPHFTRSGRIVYDYAPGQSLWVRTLFFTNARLFQRYSQTPLVGAAQFSTALHQAGVNALDSNFYSNPADDHSTDFAAWQKTAVPRMQSWLDAARENGFAFVGTGDDIQRSPGESANTLTNPWAPDAIRYSLAKLMASGNVVSIEMQDEVGGAVTPVFRRVMAILNSAPARPPVTWPVAALQSPQICAAWMGDPTLSDYASLYWTYSFDFRPGFSWGQSLWETKNALDKTVLGKLPGLQIDKPKYMEVQATGPMYFKHAVGDHFQFGLDELALPPTSPEEVTAEILYAAASGFAGIRAYGYDGFSLRKTKDHRHTEPFNDELWAYRRYHDPIDPGNKVEEQTGASPFSNLDDVRDRWQALSNGFNLIQRLEAYLLSPQINAIDLGSCIATGARELAPHKGRILIAINMCDNTAIVDADLSSYRYPSGAPVTRYHVAGLLSTFETVPDRPIQTLTMAPGEGVVWVFTP